MSNFLVLQSSSNYLPISVAGGGSPDWLFYASGGTGGWSNSSARPYDGVDGQAYAIAGSPYNAWAGPPSQLATANQLVTLNVRMMDAAAGVMARATGIDTSTLDAYTWELADGYPYTQLTKIVGGVQTVLTTYDFNQGRSYISADTAWMRLELQVVGTHIRGYLYDYNDGGWITPNNLSTARLPLVDLYDSSITSGTGCGIDTVGNSFTALYVATFTPSDITGTDARPTVSVTSPSGTISGVVTLSVSATGGASSAIVEVQYSFDGNFGTARYQSPFSASFDSTRLADGSHTISARAFDANGNWQDSSAVTVTVSNGSAGAVTMPTLPTKQAWVKQALAVYDNSADAQSWVTNYVDWGMLDAVATTWDSTIGNIDYVNVQNIYTGPVQSWNQYADAHGVSRELAYYHYIGTSTQGVTYGGGTIKCRSFWSIYTNIGSTVSAELSQPITGVAAGYGLVANQQFGPSVNDYICVGYHDRHRLLDITLATVASGGWTGVIEYPNAVNGSSVPTNWATLTPTTDGTSGFTQTGLIHFVPPSDWVASIPDGKTYLHWIRIRTTHGGTTPIASALFTEDFASSWSTYPPTVYGFDFRADADGDGYLSDAEYATRRAGMDARFAYWARLIWPYGDSRWDTNMGEADFRNWAVGYCSAQIASTGWNGLFLDNMIADMGPTSVQGGWYTPIMEPFGMLANDLASTAMRIWIGAAISPHGFAISNVLGAGTSTWNALLARSPALWIERWLSPTQDTVAEVASKRSTVLAYSASPSIVKVGAESANLLLEDLGTVLASPSPTTTGFTGSSNLNATYSYAVAYMLFTSGTLAGSTNTITGYTPATQAFTFSTPWTSAPAPGDAFLCWGEDATGIWHTTGDVSTATALAEGIGAVYPDRRWSLCATAYYYLVASPNTYFNPADDTLYKYAQNASCRQANYNVGSVTETTGGLVSGDTIGPRTLFTGSDPSGGTYTVLGRQYANALVIYRPLSAYHATVGNTSSVTFSLTGLHSAGYKAVQFDGTLGSSVITSIALRNAEGAILVPQ